MSVSRVHLLWTDATNENLKNKIAAVDWKWRFNQVVHPMKHGLKHCVTIPSLVLWLCKEPFWVAHQLAPKAQERVVRYTSPFKILASCLGFLKISLEIFPNAGRVWRGLTGMDKVIRWFARLHLRKIDMSNIQSEMTGTFGIKIQFFFGETWLTLRSSCDRKTVMLSLDPRLLVSCLIVFYLFNPSFVSETKSAVTFGIFLLWLVSSYWHCPGRYLSIILTNFSPMKRDHSFKVPLTNLYSAQKNFCTCSKSIALFFVLFLPNVGFLEASKVSYIWFTTEWEGALVYSWFDVKNSFECKFTKT